MASRQEEKEKRRREREEAERAARAKESRRKRLGMVLGTVLALAVIAIVAVAIAGSGGGGSDDPGSANANATLPAKQTDDLQEAAKAAGCTVTEHPDEGNKHLPDMQATFDDYKTNPPTSGTHRPPPASFDGVYDPGNSPDKENWVHSLEHGRVIFQYKPGTPRNRIDQLETLMDEEVGTQPGGFKTALMENNTDMTFAVAGVAWRRSVTCEEFNDKAFDALRAFRLMAIEESLAPEDDFPWPFTATS